MSNFNLTFLMPHSHWPLYRNGIGNRHKSIANAVGSLSTTVKWLTSRLFMYITYFTIAYASERH